MGAGAWTQSHYEHNRKGATPVLKKGEAALTPHGLLFLGEDEEVEEDPSVALN